MDNELAIERWGVYSNGMTREEIMSYLVARYNEDCVKSQKSKYINQEKLFNKFAKIAGVNTQTCIVCPCCNKQVSLMYRWDVERFANQLFNGTLTYWD